MPIKAVFFDLDGTLLPMDQDVFIKSYLGRIAKALAKHGYDPEALVKAIWAGTAAMVKNDGSKRNEQAFWDTFAGLFGKESLQDQPLFDRFYQEGFPAVRESCGFVPQAQLVIHRVRELGLQAVLATNPIFPAVATHQRVQWAGLEVSDFEHITTYENASFCKPNPKYYQEILDKLGLRPEECLMVGNDVTEDMVAGRLGMGVFLLTDCLINKTGEDITRYPHGGFDELLAYLEATER